jgi:hypothetical protein
MFGVWVNAHWRIKVPPFPGQFGENKQAIEGVFQRIDIQVGLINGPRGGAVAPNFLDIP